MSPFSGPFFWGTQERGVAPKPSDEVAIEAFAKIRRLCGYFSSWLTTHSQHFCGLAYQCADFFYLGPHGSQVIAPR